MDATFRDPVVDRPNGKERGEADGKKDVSPRLERREVADHMRERSRTQAPEQRQEHQPFVDGRPPTVPKCRGSKHTERQEKEEYADSARTRIDSARIRHAAQSAAQVEAPPRLLESREPEGRGRAPSGRRQRCPSGDA